MFWNRKKKNILSLREGEKLVARVSICKGDISLIARNREKGTERELFYLENEMALRRLLEENGIDSVDREY
ncbi:MAG: hypothetical protein K6G51_04965 [Sphaerochaetaceae bacterium]|nr:hypothetical protein [Sphaerochaetaceae bacterium]